MAAPDRKIALQAQHVVTGIDYVYVHASQTMLDVFFLNDPLGLTVSLASLQAQQILIYDRERNVPSQEIGIASIAWVTLSGEHALRVITTEPGDFTLYRFGIADSRIDRYFNHLSLNFKANCPSDLDCKTPDAECSPQNWVDFPVDYEARDFDSFRTALLDFAAQRYPEWNDRLEADAGVMLLEVMSALGDEMSYYQDQIGREAHLETATQRRSVRRHARLIDYPMHDGLGASTWIDLQVAAALTLDIPAGTDFWAMSDNDAPIKYEVGTSLADIIAGTIYRVAAARNAIAPHSWDEDDVCLPAGSTELFVQGHLSSILRPGGGFDVDWIVLQTAPSPGIPAKAHLVRLLTVTNDFDPILTFPIPQPITRLTWSAEDATPFEMDLTVLTVHANIVPAVAGETFTTYIIVGQDPDATAMLAANYGIVTRALEREGPGDARIYLHSLTDSDTTTLVMEATDPEDRDSSDRIVESDDPIDAKPALRIVPVTFNGTQWIEDSGGAWQYRASLLGSPSSQDNDRDYTLDDGLWQRVIGYQRPAGMIVHQDYRTGDGRTVRFGDGEFGLIPSEGTIFKVQYRLGNGTIGNVASGALQYYASAANVATFLKAMPELAQVPLATQALLNNVTSSTNPFAANNGMDAESLANVKLLAPQAFRTVTYRAVRKEDYVDAAELLKWVQRAGAEFRWTGSWLTGFVTPDPKASTELLPTQRNALQQQMDRYRQAGREIYVAEPVYADIDLQIDLCLEADALAGEVKARVLLAMFGKGGPRPVEGYFSPDRYTFGTPLRRSTLEAALQAVPGVKAVEGIRIRRRGWFIWQPFSNYEYDPGHQTIIRLNNDPLHPEQGTLKILTHGGA
jgi:hypothetical protein